MRRGMALSVLVAGLIGSVSPAYGQYPYPYGPMPYAPMPYAPMPVQYMQPYAPMPMPAMYPPAPMWQAPPSRNTNVFVYGPLTDDVLVVPPRPLAPRMPAPYPLATRTPGAGPTKPEETPVAIAQTQGVLTRGGHKTLPTYSKNELIADDFGPCGDNCAPPRHQTEPPMRGHGQFIGEVGAYFLAPFGASRIASITTANGATTINDLPRMFDVGPRASLGYIAHTGWGIRGDYEYLRGSISRATANNDPTTIITTPVLGGFQITSPSETLANGVGVDQFRFTQRLELQVADMEIVRQGHFLDTTFLGGFGARYVRMNQSYTATRTNGGGVSAGGSTFTLDREDLDSSNRFEGWGPTVSFEAVHPLGCGFSIYGNVHGSFLWGIDRFSQTYHDQKRNVNAGAVPTFVDNTLNTDSLVNRFVPVVETELGVQYGCRIGRCYWFARIGGVYQRWWDIGTPTSPGGTLNFIGGTARAGIVY